MGRVLAKFQGGNTPLLFHAYHCVKAAYSLADQIEIDAVAGDVRFPDNFKYAHQVLNTVNDIQIAYSKGWLHHSDIKNIIGIHLPKELKPASATMNMTIGLPSRFSDADNHFMNVLFEQIQKKYGSECFIDEGHSVQVACSTSESSAATYEALNYAIDFLKNTPDSKRRKDIESTVRNIVRTFHPLRHEGLVNDELLELHNKREDTNYRLNKSNQVRILGHKPENIYEINGIDVIPFATHMLNNRIDGSPAVFRFEGTEVFAHRDENKCPCLRIHHPVYTTFEHFDPYTKKQREKSIVFESLERIAQTFNEDSSAQMTPQFFHDVFMECNNELIEYGRDLESFLTEAELHNLTSEALEIAILDIPPPATFNQIAQRVHVDPMNSDLNRLLFEKLESLIDNGILIERRGTYRSPVQYSGENIPLIVTDIVNNKGYARAEPVEWNESLYGAKPRIFLSPKHHDLGTLRKRDIIQATLDYNHGSIEHLELHNKHEPMGPFLEDYEDAGIEPLAPLAANSNQQQNTEFKAPKKFRGNVRRTQGTRPDNKHNPKARKLERAKKAREQNNDGSKQPAKKSGSSERKDNIIAGIIARDPYDDHLILKSAERDLRGDFNLAATSIPGLEVGDVVYSTPVKKDKTVKVYEKLGSTRGNELRYSLLAAAEARIPMKFSDEAIQETVGMTVPDLEGYRKDYRHLPLVTIDGEDARDFDDAVYAEYDSDSANKGGYILYSAIADVSHYVKPGMALDTEAELRGNSTYFPNMVIPMLPEVLSNGLCSLNPNEDRACLVCEMKIDKEGKLLGYEFNFGLMRSRARLTYTLVQRAHEGYDVGLDTDIIQDIIPPLYGAYSALRMARDERGALDLDMNEKHVFVDENEKMIGAGYRQRTDAHKLIEEFMLCNNVASAAFVESQGHKTVARVHDKPPEEKLEAAQEELKQLGFPLPARVITDAGQFNSVIKAAELSEIADDVKELVLKCQARTCYSMDNIGHFGLGYDSYSHTTSPIRRYPDLLQHRIIRKIQTGEGTNHLFSREIMNKKCEHSSMTERRSDTATANARNRYAAEWVLKNAGQPFSVTVSGVRAFGYYVQLSNGAEGLIHVSRMKDDFYNFDAKTKTLTGANTGKVIRFGQSLTVKLVEADNISGHIEFAPIENYPVQRSGMKKKLG